MYDQQMDVLKKFSYDEFIIETTHIRDYERNCSKFLNSAVVYMNCYVPPVWMHHETFH